jgi:hypothetical protein
MMRSEEDIRAVLKQVNTSIQSIREFDKDAHTELDHTLTCRGSTRDTIEHAWVLNAISDTLSWVLQEESVVFEDGDNDSIVDLIDKILKSTQSDCDLDAMIQFGKREQ